MQITFKKEFSMRLLKSVLLACLFTASLAHAKDATMTADNEAINTACSTDSSTAGCGDQKVGTGLLKCLHAYKKSHNDFKFSDACKDAMKQRHHDKKDRK
jgi:cytochrome c2